ncbi:DUF3306 domain-containing protein [uncultured Roseobacter sp.]|uniref:DUF3306 domain-containing protein n=1 Tax=uncultured Roseobacter sp. TaxID=114847 RepID=UPI0026322F15|nr:DUF3306 domain-containing protein [uncultured Roseobacter sp.]
MTAAGSFWTRRREAVAAEAAADAQAERTAAAEAERATLAERDDAEVLAEMGLPDPAEMAAGDDFAAFMTETVPRHLQNRALRQLWRSNPVLACVDGLNEYDDDYRAAMLAGGPIQTAYQVGKGMKAHLEKMAEEAREAERAAENEVAEEEMETTELSPVVAETSDTQDPPEATVAVEPVEDPVAAAPDEAAPPPMPRRMQFHFQGDEA